MFELLVIACVGVRICEYVASPITYPTETRCAYAAALIAGTLRGRLDGSWELRYQYRCDPAGGGAADWIVIDRPIRPPERYHRDTGEAAPTGHSRVAAAS